MRKAGRLPWPFAVRVLPSKRSHFHVMTSRRPGKDVYGFGAPREMAVSRPGAPYLFLGADTHSASGAANQGNSRLRTGWRAGTRAAQNDRPGRSARRPGIVARPDDAA